MEQSKTRILKVSAESLKLAAETIASGNLVSFPTETVYGLGANALNAEACLGIFKAKGRPLTDPLIVHVHSIERAIELVSPENPKIATIFETLGKHFWPGPLTLVTKANLDKIPMVITAQTGYVGIRIPNHPVALDLLKAADLPIAAPSANKFGHVSPSKAEHVYSDFHKDSEVLILDGDSCSFGIESTVVKIVDEQNLTIIRKGGVSFPKLEEQAVGLGLKVQNLSQKQATKSEDTNCEAPGQFIRHYAPDIDSYLFDGNLTNPELQMDQAVLIDFGGRYQGLKTQVKEYVDMSAKGDCEEAINNVYEVLRWAETKKECSLVLIVDLMNLGQDFQCPGKDSEHLPALYDRLYRAASGRSA